MIVAPGEVIAAVGDCTISWVGGDGAWSDAGNWSDTTATNRLPTSADDVCIDDGDDQTALVVTISSSVTVASILNAETVEVGASRVVSISDGGVVSNAGVWRLAESSRVQG
ncbi:MAG: hypothetical protein CL424_14180, partial [Acidimicrobiaceae bacterium]|nr:hypothetical protein [Acidimicrobiaceae bacterium]